MSEKRITVEEWLRELESAQRKSGGSGQTVREIQDQTGATKTKVLDMLRQAKEKSRLVVSKKEETNIAGRTCVVPCYTIVRERPRKKD